MSGVMGPLTGPPAELGGQGRRANAPRQGFTQEYVRRGYIQPGEGIRPTGPAAAAVLAAGVGLLAMAVARLIAATYQPFEAALLVLGRLFFPGGDSVGGYSGNELIALVVWLGGWALLHRRLRQRQVGLTGVTVILLICLLTATLLLWPPFTRLLVRLVR